MQYVPEYHADWKGYFDNLPNDIKERAVKKIRQILGGLPGRHLKHGLDFFVEEMGQYRICYKSLENSRTRCFYFVGTHKEYEKWLGL
jgi:hypothetical protein